MLAYCNPIANCVGMFSLEFASHLASYQSIGTGEHNMATVKFQGILFATVDASPNVAIPDDMEPVEGLHITLLSSELDKEARKRFKKAWKENSDKLLPFPKVTFGPAYVADSGKKRSLVCNVMEQDLVRQWVVACLAMLGIEADAYYKVYHVSVANPTGSKFDSVPDPWNHRKG